MKTAPPSQFLVKRSGRITNYSSEKFSASFVFADEDRSRLGMIAVAASAVGLGGQAAATLSSASSVEEEADRIHFKLDGLAVNGWIWRSPFKEGDDVEVVGRLRGSELEAVAIARPSDRTIALYPHCSRGRLSHYLNAAKWWLIGSTAVGTLYAFVSLLLDGPQGFAQSMSEGGVWVVLGFYGFFALMTASLSRKWARFPRLAEEVFMALGWPEPMRVDLVESSKAQRRSDDSGEFGTFYFRY